MDHTVADRTTADRIHKPFVRRCGQPDHGIQIRTRQGVMAREAGLSQFSRLGLRNLRKRDWQYTKWNDARPSGRGEQRNGGACLARCRHRATLRKALPAVSAAGDYQLSVNFWFNGTGCRRSASRFCNDAQCLALQRICLRNMVTLWSDLAGQCCGNKCGRTGLPAPGRLSRRAGVLRAAIRCAGPASWRWSLGEGAKMIASAPALLVRNSVEIRRAAHRPQQLRKASKR